VDPDEVISWWKADREIFLAVRQRFLLYPRAPETDVRTKR
jgi:hypothetical protein